MKLLTFWSKSQNFSASHLKLANNSFSFLFTITLLIPCKPHEIYRPKLSIFMEYYNEITSAMQ